MTKYLLQFAHPPYSVPETIILSSIRYNAVRTVVHTVRAPNLPSCSRRIMRGFHLPGLREADKSALMTGMREQEVMHCSWNDINIARPTVTVRYKPEY